MSALAFHASIAGALPSKLKGLFSLLVLICLANIGHAQLGWGTPKMENPGAFSINFCEDDPVGEYQMNWVGVGSPATNPKLTVVLPAGYNLSGRVYS